MSLHPSATVKQLAKWNFPELETPPAPVLAPPAPVRADADNEPRAAGENDATADRASATDLFEEQIAKGYAEGWQRGLVESRQTGYAEGFAAGTKAAEEALAQQSERLAAILTRLGTPLPALESVVEEAVLALALEVARCVIGREISQSRDYLVKLIREAVAKVPIEMSGVTVVVNPADLELIRSLAPDIEHRSASLVGDEGVEPGDCLVIADGQGAPIKDMRWRPRAGEGMSQVDLSVAARWRAVMLALFEGEDK